MWKKLPKIVAYGTFRRNRLHSAARTNLKDLLIPLFLIHLLFHFLCRIGRSMACCGIAAETTWLFKEIEVKIAL